jgi:hypothetical protein
VAFDTVKLKEGQCCGEKSMESIGKANMRKPESKSRIWSTRTLRFQPSLAHSTIKPEELPMLSLKPYMWKGEGPNLGLNRKAIAFEVVGLRANQKTLIAELDYAWQLLRIVDGVSGNWSGEHNSPETALASIH